MAGNLADPDYADKTPHEALLLKLRRNYHLAHQTLFHDRHSDTTPDFHYDMISLWHSVHPRINTMAFREGGKSTIAEEALILGAAYGLFRNAIIVGNTEKRACERLTAIKHELSTNELLAGMFGAHDEHTSKVWNEAEIILSTDVRIAALGRGQSLRGTKYLQWRPDFLFCDDIEEVEKGQVYSDEEAFETVRWFNKVLVAALDKNARIRVNSTPLSRNALPMHLARDRDWLTRTYPIEYLSPEGERAPTWPSRYPLPWIDARKATFVRSGILNDWMQEYMCVAEDREAKLFKHDMFRVLPREHTWEATFAMYDPARTTKQTSATTGWAVWSFLGQRMIVWDGGGNLWKPDELISHLFMINERYSPVEIGIEEDGLNDWILQPLRHEQLRRNTLVPVRAMKAPKGKLQFIEGLQVHFAAREVSFAKELPELLEQFLSFPSGRIDGPNALAYSQKMKPGEVVYENFASLHVVDSLLIRSRVPVWLCCNAGHGMTTAVAAQLVDGALHILADWVREGDPGQTLLDIAREASLDYGEVRFLAGPRHWDQYDRFGMRGAVAKLPAELKHGGQELTGREEIRAMLQRSVRGEPAFKVAMRARWILNALSAGYARAVDKRGIVQEEAREGVYRVLMEGLESFTGLLRIGSMTEDRPNIRVTEGGQRYVSALPGKTAPLPSKADILRPDRITDLGHLTARRTP